METKLMDFFCPKTGEPIGWAFDYVPERLYCRTCKRDHTPLEQPRELGIKDLEDVEA
jgi:hypothetical protein